MIGDQAARLRALLALRRADVERRAGPAVRSEINVTPLVDVVLVLLIIFMVVTPLLEKDIEVRVPERARVPYGDLPVGDLDPAGQRQGDQHGAEHAVDESPRQFPVVRAASRLGSDRQDDRSSGSDGMAHTIAISPGGTRCPGIPGTDPQPQGHR